MTVLGKKLDKVGIKRPAPSLFRVKHLSDQGYKRSPPACLGLNIYLIKDINAPIQPV